MFSIAVSESVDTYDQGYLRHHMTRSLVSPTPLTKIKDISRFLRDFSSEHNRVLQYRISLSQEWEICNYAYEEIMYDKEQTAILGLMYHVTGQDGSRSDGDKGLVFQAKKNALLFPMDLNLEARGFESIGFYVEEKLSREFTSRHLYLGDIHALVPMPCFRGRGSILMLPSMQPSSQNAD